MKKARSSKRSAGLAKITSREARLVKKVKAPRADASAWEPLETIPLHAAGIDVGGSENFVAVPAPAVKPGEPAVRSFGVFTAEQDALVK